MVFEVNEIIFIDFQDTYRNILHSVVFNFSTNGKYLILWPELSQYNHIVIGVYTVTTLLGSIVFLDENFITLSRGGNNKNLPLKGYRHWSYFTQDL